MLSNSDLITDVKYFSKFVRTLKLEGIAQASLMFVLTYKSGSSLWFLAYTFLIFDISMVGYMFNSKVGAFLYNIGHSSVNPTILLIFGLLGEYPSVRLWSYAWLFHIGVDRAVGYGLKHPHSFHHTHLGIISAKKK